MPTRRTDTSADAMGGPDDFDSPFEEPARAARSKVAAPTPPRQIPRNRPLTPAEVEEHIVERIAYLEEGSEILEQRTVAAAIAEAEYRIIRARGILLSSKKLGVARESDGLYQARDELRSRGIYEALQAAAQDSQRTHRSILDALRTLAVNARQDAAG